jgi:hypothetical protein
MVVPSHLRVYRTDPEGKTLLRNVQDRLPSEAAPYHRTIGSSTHRGINFNIRKYGVINFSYAGSINIKNITIITTTTTTTTTTTANNNNNNNNTNRSCDSLIIIDPTYLKF